MRGMTTREKKEKKRKRKKKKQKVDLLRGYQALDIVRLYL